MEKEPHLLGSNEQRLLVGRLGLISDGVGVRGAIGDDGVAHGQTAEEELDALRERVAMCSWV